MIKFDKDKVLLLQQSIIESSGGTAGVRDFKLLDSALNSCYQTFGREELYPTKEEKGARLGFNLVSNHAFVDNITSNPILLFPSTKSFHIQTKN